MAHNSFAPGEEAQPEWEDFGNAEDFINDEDRFNVTSRIESLFPSIDVSPKDGFLTVEELIQWNIRQEAAETLHRTKRDLVLHDKNKDGLVSFEEYDPPRWMRGIFALIYHIKLFIVIKYSAFSCFRL